METYTWKDWERDGELNPKIGQPVAEQIVREIGGCVPPIAWSHNLVQCGEPWDNDMEVNEMLYTTFKRTEQGWIYCGHCLPGKTEDRPGYIATLYPPKNMKI